MSGAARSLRLGVDIGGTFTDLVFLHADGRLDKIKVPSTPDDYSRAITEGVATYCAQVRLEPAEIFEVLHATTVATNAILERKGAKTALITTAGFRDVLELRRIRIPMSYDLGWEKPVPLVEREWRIEVAERLDASGNVLVPLETAAVEAAVRPLIDAAMDAVAVCFLHSYRDPRHEQLAGAVLRRLLPDAYISLSHEVLPEMLEYERTSTTVVNAYVGPLIGRYLARLRERFNQQRITAPLLVMQSNGGLVSAGTAAARPVTIIESGPAAGVVAAARLARDCGHANVITLDMGGTTTKASIIEAGEMLRAAEYEVGSRVSASSRLMRGNGYLLRIPVIDVSEVGAGGGSIAALDAGGSLRVGPLSAGAVPGPACYGQGNSRPTVTDANLVLGFLGADSLAGGAMLLQRELAVRALQSHVADPAGLSLLDAAWGVHVIANSNMVRAIKSVSVERGRDPAAFALMAFGGAGPVHAVSVAAELGIRTVIVPPAPGVFSAFGLLRADIEHHAARTVLTSTAHFDGQKINRAISGMREELAARMRAEGYDPGDIKVATHVDLRYCGQSSEITVALPEGRVDKPALHAAEQRFELEFERTYGHRGKTQDFELVTCRLVATLPRATQYEARWEPDTVAAAPTRAVYFGGAAGSLQTRVVARRALAYAAIAGPAIVQEYDTSVVIPPGWQARLDTAGNIVATAT